MYSVTGSLYAKRTLVVCPAPRDQNFCCPSDLPAEVWIQSEVPRVSVMVRYAGEYCEYGKYCDAWQSAVTVIRNRDVEVLPRVANKELRNR